MGDLLTTYRAYASVGDEVRADPDSGSVCLGTEFYVTQSGCTVTQIHWRQSSNFNDDAIINTANRTMAIYVNTGTGGTTGTLVYGPVSVTTGSTRGWITHTLSTPLALTANQRYRVVTLHPSGKYSATNGYYASGGAGGSNTTFGPLVIPGNSNVAAARQGSYAYSGSMTYPNNTYQGASYWNDVTIDDGVGSTPTITASLSGSGSLSSTVSPYRTLPSSSSSTGTLSGSASSIYALSASGSGSGLLTSTFTPIQVIDSILSSTGTLNATAEEGEQPSNEIAASLTNSGLLTTDVASKFEILSTSLSTGTLSATSTPIFALNFATGSESILTASATPIFLITSTLTSTGNFSSIVTEVKEGASGPAPSFVLINNRLRLIF